jgi:hypothetical protein
MECQIPNCTEVATHSAKIYMKDLKLCDWHAQAAQRLHWVVEILPKVTGSATNSVQPTDSAMSEN